MPRVMFTISYGIKPELREQYLEHIKKLRQHIIESGKKNYSVFEVKGKKNHFTEVFITESVEEYEALEDNQDETTQSMVSTLEKFLDGKGMKYRTLIESV
jgi:hypothetical protein